jgi:hypothetical protein
MKLFEHYYHLQGREVNRMKEQLNKGLFAALMTIVILVAALGALVFSKGEAVLFAITNEAQVMDEKERWNAHIASYGQVSELPKAQ